MQRAVIELPGDHALAGAIVAHDQVEGEIFDIEFGIVAQALAIERVQNGVAGAVGGGAGALHRRTIAEFGHVAAKGALVDLAVFGARKRHAIVLELIDGRGGLARQIFHGVVVAQPVRPLDGVVHVPFPAVGPHILQGCRNAALRRHGVAAGGKNLGDAGSAQALFGHAQGRTEAGAAGAHHHHVEFVVDEFILRHGH